MADETTELGYPVIGIGASAGGLEAIQNFLSATPPDSGLAFVFVQHLDPQHKSMLAELLRRHTSMDVIQVTDEMVALPNRIHLIPPNATLTINGGILRLKQPAEPRPIRAPIDTFFRSLAEDQGRNAAAVVLSGTGSDGAQGLRAIKEMGGLTMAQLAETARYDGMPKSAEATGVVDYVLPVEQMPQTLLTYFQHIVHLAHIKGPDRLAAETQDYIDQIFGLLRQATGHDFSDYKRTTVSRRIQRRIQILQLESVDEYIDRLKREPIEVDRLFRDLLIGVTQFFRDPETFERLSTSVIPDLLSGKGNDDTVRIWVPACATGEEAFSIAILLRECAVDRIDRPRLQIFATDIDEHALEIARIGRYPMTIAKDVSPERLRRFFVAEGEGYRLTKEVRESCIFSCHDIIRDPPFSKLDLISCRNLFIYLSNELQDRIIPLFHYALNSGGCLFLGPSESLTGHTNLFTPIDQKSRLFRRRDVATRPAVDFPIASAMDRKRRIDRQLEQTGGLPDPGYLRAAERRILDKFAPAFVVIDHNLEVLSLSDRTGIYLEHAPGVISTNLLDMARRSIRLDLRAGVREAIRQHHQSVRKSVMVAVDGGAQVCDLIVEPLSAKGGDEGIYMVVFRAVGPFKPGSEPEAEEPGTTAAADMRQLEEELRVTQERLHSTIEELESSNEEMKSSNEELMSMNEELQSTNEELETSKEELQSVNEELETVNSELRSKVDELNRANSDIRNLFDSTSVATIFVDKKLELQNFTPAARAIFSLRESDVGRPLTDLAPRIAYEGLGEDVAVVVRTLIATEKDVMSGDGTTQYVMKVSPYRTIDDVIEGAVVTFVDVTRLKLIEDKLSEQRGVLEAILRQAADGVIVADRIGRLVLVNDAARRLAVIDPEGKELGDVESAWGRCFDQHDEPIAPSRWHNARALEGETVMNDEVRMVRADGSHYHLGVAAAPVRNSAGEIIASVAILNDITQRKHDEERLTQLRIEAERANLAKSELLAILSHELRTPLNAILGFSELMQQEMFGPMENERYRDYVASIHNSGVYLHDLVNEVLDFARTDSGHMQIAPSWCEFGALVESVLKMVQVRAESLELTIVRKFQSPDLRIYSDDRAFKQMLFNLLTNAVKFNRPKGTITIAAGVAADGSLVISVEDTGIGISPDDLQKVRRPFQQGRAPAELARQGAGLGLALIDNLIELHGGRMTIESELGVGSKFTLYFPPPASETQGGEDSAAYAGFVCGVSINALA